MQLPRLCREEVAWIELSSGERDRSDGVGVWAESSVSNITGNGHTVYYDSSACPALGGKTFALNGGGTLTPSN